MLNSGRRVGSSNAQGQEKANLSAQEERGPSFAFCSIQAPVKMLDEPTPIGLGRPTLLGVLNQMLISSRNIPTLIQKQCYTSDLGIP